MLKFAVLATDTLVTLPELVQRFGGFDRMLSSYLYDAAAFTRVEFSLDVFDVVEKQEYPNEDDYNLIIVTGSTISILKNDPWMIKLREYIKRVVETKPQVKWLGICYGHEIIAEALGGACESMNGKWEVGASKIELTSLGQELFGANELFINQAHRNEVSLLPESLQSLGSTPTCPYQALVRFNPGATSQAASDVHILTFQGHPEFGSSIMKYVLMLYGERGVANEQTISEAKARVRQWPDGGVDVIGKVVWRMMGVTV